MPLAALIFDVDGTLAETEELHRRAFNETFAELEIDREWPDTRRGWVWDQPTYARLLATTGGKERITAYLGSDLGVDPSGLMARIADIHRAKTARYVALMQSGQITLRPGIAALIHEAKQQKIMLAIATTTSRPNIDALCRACFRRETIDVFDVVAAGDEVAAKKPAADVYLLALRRLGLSPGSCIALEDSRNGLLSAKAAGLYCVVSPGTYTARDDLSGADLAVEDFSQVDIGALILATA